MWESLAKLVLRFFRGKGAEERAESKHMQQSYERLLVTAERRLDRAESRIDALETAVRDCEVRCGSQTARIVELERLVGDGK